MNNVVRVEDSKYLTGQGGSGGSGGHTIQNDSGTALAQESALQFVGVYSEDDSTNGKTKVNIVREMTKAQMDALSTDAKKGVIHTTDEADNPANPISAEDVSYGDGTVEQALDELNEATTSDGMHNATAETGITVLEYLRWWKIGKMVIVDLGGISVSSVRANAVITQNLPLMRSRPTGVLRSDAAQDTALIYGIIGTSQLRFSGGHSANTSYYGQVIYMTD